MLGGADFYMEVQTRARLELLIFPQWLINDRLST